MSLFNTIKRNAVDVANKTVKKTGELTNIAKLTMNIKNAESKLSDTFETIGHLFYEAQRNGEDHTEEIASCVMKADKYEAEIAGLKKELAALRNVVICPVCGSEIKNDAAFCSYCGAKIEKPASEECCCCCCECEETEADTECECDSEDCGCCECDDTAEADECKENEECGCCCCNSTEEAEETEEEGTEDKAE